MELTLDNVTKVVEEQINPQLALHNGSAEVVSVDGNVVELKLHGGCSGCPSSILTLYSGIVPILQEDFPNIEVIPL